jgi:hypothetical protein
MDEVWDNKPEVYVKNSMSIAIQVGNYLHRYHRSNLRLDRSHGFVCWRVRQTDVLEIWDIATVIKSIHRVEGGRRKAINWAQANF